MKVFSKLKAIDFFKKSPSDLTEATLAGAWLSIAATELYSFLTIQTSTQLIVDRSSPSELLKINFNISFPALSCEFATLDVSDALGTTVRKAAITLDLQRLGAAADDTPKPGPKYDAEG
ncbi:protein disulfide isomerase, partial [Haematococcus lacustris]